ncbi:sodium/proline symporter [Marinagarivorans algicola]|uniref:sodium/proline symporter n=1 Tax=Marinagarivorans algicola TaxID=1513270 RepID=UPI0006B47D7B|nr:sodium/proline symporter [Marinagarivorans algicola]
MLISFCFLLFAFVAIGLLSSRKSQGTKHDYYLASNTVSPSLVGLSAVATNNSGYMFIGVIGYTYTVGLSAIWLMCGWILGDFLASVYMYSRIRKATDQTQAMSYSQLLSAWQGQNQPILQKVIALISLAFLLIYASAQLLAGSKALHVLLDWPLWSGAVIGSIMVALYCMAGGIRASIWTDAAQSVVMIIAMMLLLFVGVYELGGIKATLTNMHAIDHFMQLAPKDTAPDGWSGIVLFILGWTVAGFCVAGQPHIMVRFMTLNNTRNMRQAKIWYYSWFVAFYCMATAVGLLARLYITDTGAFDPELALPTMATHLLPPALVGLVLAGIFAATMSTADSLLLNCSSAVTNDLKLMPKSAKSTFWLKITTVLLTVLALILALTANNSVFNLVIMAWSGLGSAFVPLLIILCLGAKPSQLTSIIMVLAGLSGAYLWRHFGLHGFVFEGVAGITLGITAWLALYGYSRLKTPN